MESTCSADMKKQKNQHHTSLLTIVSETFSIRGVPRLNRGPPFLRSLWFCFIVSMTFGLFLTSYYLVQDYLLYDVSVNAHVALDAQSPFPALTVCHHHPFSSVAYDLWRQNKVMSPNDFNRRMRNLTQHYLEQNNLMVAEALYQYDSISIYYQNIPVEAAYLLGHNTSIFLNCMRRVEQTMHIEDDCLQLEGFRIRQFSHHTFFNCHTIEPKNKIEAEATDMLALIVSLGPKPDYGTGEQAFLTDLFEMARGLRVVVHEPGTYPDLEREGLHVEPGKLNEINYQPVLWERLHTPRKPCREEAVDRSYERASIVKETLPRSPSSDYAYAYSDLNVSYRYTQSQCILLYEQRNIIDQCHCQFIYNPRPQMPSEQVPYCGYLMKNQTDISGIIDRIVCLQGQMDSVMKRYYESIHCFPRCNYYKYESTISVTTWRAVDWQLHWLRQLNNAFKAMGKEQESQGESWNLKESPGYAKWMEYYEKTNLTNIPPNAIENLNLEGNNFAYVVLKRRSRDVMVNREKLVLSVSVLLSRVGGLCSLTIGLTAGFVVELIEFIYLICTNKSTNEAGRAAYKSKTSGPHLQDNLRPTVKAGPLVRNEDDENIQLNNVEQENPEMKV